MTKQTGMTLIELMVSMAIGLVVVAGLSRYLIHTSQIHSRFRSVNAISTEINTLQKNLARTSTCTGYFAGMSFNPNGGAQDLPSSPNPLSMQFAANEKITLVSSQLTALQKLETIVLNVTTTYERYLANLTFRFKTSADSPGGEKLKPIQVPIQILVNSSTHSIVSCESDFGNPGEYCQLIGGIYNPTQMPPCKMPPQTPPCPTSKVASGFVTNDIDCISPPLSPSGWPPQPTVSSTDNYVELIPVDCLPSKCECPPHHPMYFFGGLPGSTITCGGIIQVPPAVDPNLVAACLAPLDEDMVNCALLDGVRIRAGFGPCYNCP